MLTKDELKKIVLETSIIKRPRPHGLSDTRSLGYYAGVGMDYFNHDYGMLDDLAEAVAEAIMLRLEQYVRSSDTEGQSS